ncbi:MAG: hypothetical protein KQH63_10915 [Desulfobulbaceae bacterium]|nr:hypothetical protein [Desulfobulbaceae bacterium]
MKTNFDEVAKSPEADHPPTKYQQLTHVPAAVEEFFTLKGINALSEAGA